jgi:hypothetical protein
MRQSDYKWMISSTVDNSSMVWIIMINGFAVAIHNTLYEIQEQAFQKGLAPYIPK